MWNIISDFNAARKIEGRKGMTRVGSINRREM